MGVVFTNNAETTLAAAITSTSATSISVTSSSTFPAIQAGEHFYATLDDGTNNEIVKVTGVSGTTWTVVRASDSTTARTFANGITVQLRATAALLTDIQENIAAKSANQTVYNATAASNATAYDVGVNPGVEANAMVFLDGVMQHHDTFSFSGSTLTFDAAPTNGTKIEVIVDNLINLQSSNLTTDTFTATSGQTDFTLSDAPAAENNLIVFIDGVFQDQGNYSISNHTLTLATGAVVGRTVTVYIINPVNIGTPSDGTVTGAKLSGNITMPGTLTVGAFDVAFDSPTFVVDNANSRVGLGTASPSVPVDIVGDVKMSANLTVDTTTLVVDSTNNRVGIGVSSPASPLHVNTSGHTDLFIQSGTSHSSTISLGDSGDQDIGQIGYSNASNFMNFVTNASERMRIDASGNVGIGVTNPDAYYAKNLVVAAPDEGGISVVSNSTHQAYLMFADGTSGSQAYRGYLGYDHNNDNFNIISNGIIKFYTDDPSVERVRIDSSGNLLVGKTAPTISTTGVELRPNGQVFATQSGNYPLLLNRTTSDGDIIQLRKDGTTVGNISSEGGDALIIQSGTTSGSGLLFHPSNGQIYPVRNSVKVDATIDLGRGANRFKDLYLSGNAYVGASGFLSNNSGEFIKLDNVDDTIEFSTTGSERMRIDSSGNLLVGNTVVNPVSGFASQKGFGYAASTGKVEIATDANAAVMELGKNNANDGSILVFRKQSNVVGSIGVNSGDIYIASTGTYSAGLMFEGSSGAQDIRPCSSTGALLNGAVDLGDSSAKFKDLHLNGQILFGGNSVPFESGNTLSSSTNYDSLFTNGHYRIDNNATNAPSNTFHAVIVFGNGSNVTSQIAVSLASTTTYIRSYNNSWTSWARLDT